VQANGFFGSRGVSGRIPEGYTLLEQRFMRAVAASGRNWRPDMPQRGIELMEWAREGWTYHAKGLYPCFLFAKSFAQSVKPRCLALP
jgi:CDP-diacylglycerol--glycerol-3-phosphate 3-phosphatidyltransferase